MSVLGNRSPTDAATLQPVLELHGDFIETSAKLTGKDKRSFASKYLHFHRPTLFFIYDSRASNAVRKPELGQVPVTVTPGMDTEYAKCSLRLISLRHLIADQFGVSLTPRQLDRLLLAIGAA